MVPSAREAHLAVLMIGYSDPLTRRLASFARPSPPDGWCAVGWRRQGQRSAQRKGPSGWPQMPAPVRRPKAEALSGGDREALAEALGKQARVRRSRVFCAASTEISGAITPARMRISHERSSWAGGTSSCNTKRHWRARHDFEGVTFAFGEQPPTNPAVHRRRKLKGQYLEEPPWIS